MSGPKGVTSFIQDKVDDLIYNIEQAKKEREERERKALNKIKSDLPIVVGNLRKNLETQYNNIVTQINMEIRKTKAAISALPQDVSLFDQKYTFDEERKALQNNLLELEKKLEEAEARKTKIETQINNYQHTVESATTYSQVRYLNPPSFNITSNITTSGDSSKILENAKKKEETLKGFKKVVEQFVSGLGGDKSDFAERIKKRVLSINPTDPNSINEIKNIISELRKEIEALEAETKLYKTTDEVYKKSLEEIVRINGVISQLNKVVTATERYQVVETNIKKLNEQQLERLQEKLDILRENEYVVKEKPQLILEIERRLSGFKSNLSSPQTGLSIEREIVNIESVIKQYKEIHDRYLEFDKAKQAYEEVYLKFPKEFYEKVSIGKTVVDPKTIKFVEDVNKVDELIKQINELVDIINTKYSKVYREALINKCQKEIGKKKVLKKVTSESTSEMYYVNEDYDGIIFHIVVNKENKVQIYPRIVQLHNGVVVSGDEGLKKAHASCKWYNDFAKCFGVDEASERHHYEEIGDDVTAKTFEKEEYFVCKTLEESKAYLEKMGYSKEKIASLLGIEIEKVSEIEEEDEIEEFHESESYLELDKKDD